jgi:dipeptidyl aminopeptidase/acylaminoacyl peptidase
VVQSADHVDVARRPGGRRLRWALIALVVVASGAYAAAVVRLMTQETELIFRTGAARADTQPPFPYERVELPRTDGARQFAWRIERKPIDEKSIEPTWVLFLHGNASTVASRMNVKHYGQLRELGLNVLAPEYRGYNGLEGVPSEAGVAADARAAYDYLRDRVGIPAERVVIFGWSLGAAVAVGLASTVEARGVVLEGAPASIVDIGQQRYPMFPVRWIIRNPFNAIEKVAGIRAPLLFLHSPEDTIVPFKEGRRLFDAAPSPKTFVEVRGGHIESSEIDRDVFYGAVRSFLQASATAPQSH